MLKFEHITVGTTIRSYDFEPMEGREDRFVEGTVIAHDVLDGASMLVIDCSVDSAFPDPDYSRVGSEVFVPMEMSMFEYDGRVVEI